MIGHQQHRTKGYVTLSLPTLLVQVAPSTSGVELRLKAIGAIRTVLDHSESRTDGTRNSRKENWSK